MDYFKILLSHLDAEFRAIRTAPAVFALAVIVAGLGSWGSVNWVYASILAHRNDRIELLSEEVARYRVVIGIDPATKSALLNLNNKELRAKAFNIVGRMRDFDTQFRDGLDAIHKNSKLSDNQQIPLEETLARNIDRDYARSIRSDVFNLDSELRRRLGPKGTASIVGIAPTVYSTDGAPVDVLQLTAVAGMEKIDLGFISNVSMAIDQMARLLPENG